MFASSLQPLVAPPPPPTCWEFFGLCEPTSRHNLELLYRERINAIVPAGFSNAMTEAYVHDRYQECLKEIEQR